MITRLDMIYLLVKSITRAVPRRLACTGGTACLLVRAAAAWPVQPCGRFMTAANPQSSISVRNNCNDPKLSGWPWPAKKAVMNKLYLFCHSESLSPVRCGHSLSQPLGYRGGQTSGSPQAVRDAAESWTIWYRFAATARSIPIVGHKGPEIYRDQISTPQPAPHLRTWIGEGASGLLKESQV